MIKVNTNETFTITAMPVDESTGTAVTGQTVSYYIRNASTDAAVSNGTMTESLFEPGIYRKNLTVASAGNYIIYVTCTGYLSDSEALEVNDDLLNLVKEGRHYNISVEDVLRTNATPTASQTTRKVPLGYTDYVVTKVKNDADADWSSPIATGTVYAWYRTITDTVPYLMGGPN